MIIYLLILAAIVLVVFVFVSEKKNSKVDFEIKQHQLRNNISLQTNHLKIQKKKTELADEMKQSMKSNNEELLKKVAALNNSLFEEINKKNKNI